MINSVYGKAMENLRKRIYARLVNNEKDYWKHVNKPTFISQKVFDKNFVAVHDIKPVLTFNNPVYVGFTILELSKWLMYDFHYNFIKKNFDANLLFTDPESVIYEIKSKDVYVEFFKYKHLFDFTKYQLNIFIQLTKKLFGKMKDEFKGITTNKFTGLK